jgi:WD repeat-containing protein 55
MSLSYFSTRVLIFQRYKDDPPVLIHSITPQALLVATDSSALHIYDLRSSSRTFTSTKPSSTYNPHEDYITSLTPILPAESSSVSYPNRFLTTGGTTLAVTDLRRGVQTRSDDQGTELLASAYVTGFSKRGTSVGTKVIAGDADGILTLWEKGVWDDQDERIVMSRMLQRFDPAIFGQTYAGSAADSVECMVNVPEDVIGNERAVAVGLSSGMVALLQLGSGGHKVIDLIRHHEVEGAEKVGFDVYGRIITGGGPVIKVWREKQSAEKDDGWEDDEKEEEEEEKESDQADSEEDDDEESESENDRPRKRRKGGQTNRKMGSFKGLD